MSQLLSKISHMLCGGERSGNRRDDRAFHDLPRSRRLPKPKLAREAAHPGGPLPGDAAAHLNAPRPAPSGQSGPLTAPWREPFPEGPAEPAGQRPRRSRS